MERLRVDLYEDIYGLGNSSYTASATILPSCYKVRYFMARHFKFLYIALYDNKYMEKLVILQSIGIIAIKSKETRVITYTCRYSSGHIIHVSFF